MGTVITVANHKGGVAKTTSVLNIAMALTELGKSVLAVDLDPQASLTIAAGERPVQLEEQRKTIAAVLVEGVAMKDIICETNLLPNLVASSLDLGRVDLERIESEGQGTVVRDHLATVKDDYDFVLLDCPPNMGVMMLNGVAAADAILIPTRTDMLSVAGIEALFGFIRSVQMETNPTVEICGCIPTAYSARNRIDQESLGYLKKLFEGIAPVFEPVPQSTEFARSIAEGRAVAFKGIKAKGKPYMRVAKELVNRYG